MTVFTVDGKAYPGLAVMELKRSFSVLDTANSGRTIADGKMHRDIIGTYYNYELTLKIMNQQQYDDFYEIISSPTTSHVVTLPYGQGSMTMDAYVTDGEDSLKLITEKGNLWDEITIKFVAMEARRTPR